MQTKQEEDIPASVEESSIVSEAKSLKNKKQKLEKLIRKVFKLTKHHRELDSLVD